MGVSCGCIKSKSIVITKMASCGGMKQYDNTDVDEIEEETFCSKYTRNYIFTPTFFKKQLLITKEREETADNLQQENENNSKFLSPISETSNKEDTFQKKQGLQSYLKLDSKRASLEQRFMMSPSQIKRNSLQQKNNNKMVLFAQQQQFQEQRERRILLKGTFNNEQFNKNEENK